MAKKDWYYVLLCSQCSVAITYQPMVIAGVEMGRQFKCEECKQTMAQEAYDKESDRDDRIDEVTGATGTTTP